MTAMPRELTRLQPAEIIPHASTELANHPEQPTRAISHSTRVLLRLAAALFMLMAVAQMWFAATGNRL